MFRVKEMKVLWQALKFFRENVLKVSRILSEVFNFPVFSPDPRKCPDIQEQKNFLIKNSWQKLDLTLLLEFQLLPV